MKYIVVEAPDGEAPILFPRSFAHRYVADLFSPMAVVAAGFVDARNGVLTCHGASSGLKTAARPEQDTALVNRVLAG